ncbi:cysteine desulfurase family protein [Microscilla marina]|uniref:cysteine desulfurase n=1 Tax=Microscilla marina ATCC 23134 TaxID=313606 RepID=A1ZIJ1_MICM2|nr:cysteine desulfurase family protein [Microscilla marina]EAY29859.1 NifS protein [Microscilla marina ATCC 23134]
MENQDFIYLDNNATTPVDPRVLETMMPYLTRNFANAASRHQPGLDANQAVNQAREQIAKLIGSKPSEIIFTSGATEGINLAVKGMVETQKSKGKHIITLATEHKAMLDTYEFLASKGFDVEYLPVKPDGLLDLEVLKKAVREDTVLVSVMLANNETGVIQPLKEISAIVHEAGAFFMTDATQAFGKLSISVNDLGIDLMTFSGHKIYAPKGIGGIYFRSRRPFRVKLEAIIHGGGHEKGMRSGTLNVPGIIALGKAAEVALQDMEKDAKQVQELRDYLEQNLLQIEDTTINGNTTHRLYNTSNIFFQGVDSDALIANLDSLAFSSGSACTSASVEPSHVLIALGLSKEDAYCCMRFSLGRFTTKEEINKAIELLKEAIENLRALRLL